MRARKEGKREDIDMNAWGTATNEKIDKSDKNINNSDVVLSFKALIFSLIFISLVPVILVFVFILSLPAIIDWLIHYNDKREYLDSTSAVFWFGNPGNVIHAILEFEKQADPKQIIDEAIPKFFSTDKKNQFRRWRQVIVENSLFWAYWKSIPDSDDCRGNIFTNEESFTHKGVEDEVARLSATPLPANRPPWAAHVFKNCKNEKGDSCSLIVLRLHHSIGDGYALLRGILQGCDIKFDKENDKKSEGKVIKKMIMNLETIL